MTSRKIRTSHLTLILLAWACGAHADGDPFITLRVSRDFRTPPILEKRARCSGKSVMKLLQESATVGTAFGNGFVQSINGMAAGKGGDARRAWLYYVNGLAADVGAAQCIPECGDCIAWDLHPCNGAVTVPNLIGCFPQPFLGLRKRGAAPLLVLHDAHSSESARALARSLERQGAGKTRVQPISGSAIPGDAASIVVGRWDDLIGNATLRRLYEHREACGIFVEFDKDGLHILSLDRTGRKSLAGAGVILAARGSGAPPMPLWIVSGTDGEQTTNAAEILINEPGKIQGMASAVVSGGKIYPAPMMDAFNE